jgi:hypothetical protein
MRDKTKKSETRKKLRLLNKIKSVEYLGGKCSVCGHTNINSLDFHHIKDKKHQISRMLSCYSNFTTIQKELDKCILVCRNCHQEIHSKEKTKNNIGNRHSRKYKKLLCDIHGGKCSICGYSKCIRSLDFHHVVESSKCFTISTKLNSSLSILVEESKKCSLLCANCHQELHSNHTTIKLQYTFNEEKFRELTKLEPKTDECPICHKQKPLKNKYCSLVCCGLSKRKVDRPSKKQLEKLIKAHPLTHVGKMFNVTDNTIRKWCKSMEISYR